MAKYTKPDLMNTVWASSASESSIAEPDSDGSFSGVGIVVDVEDGWTQVKPPYQVENWLQNKHSQFSAYINQLGIPEWDSETEYQTNKSYVQGSDNKLYKCIQTHTNRNPASSNTSYWEVFEGSRAATTEARGTVELATLAEAYAGTGNKVMTASIFQAAQATEDDYGIVQYSTQDQVNTGTATRNSVTPATLSGRTATTTRTGLVSLATLTESYAGNSTKVLTPSIFLQTQATEDSYGVVQYSTQDQVNTGTATRNSVTPATLSGRTATEDRTGVISVASNAETSSGVSDVKAITPAKLRLGVSFLAGQNGYVALPTWMGGFIIQWGVSNCNGNDVTNVSYNTSFPNTVYSLVTSDTFSTSLTDGQNVYSIATYLRSNSTFDCVMNASNNDANLFSWIAIGR